MRRAMTVVVIVVVGLVALGGLFWVSQRRLIYFPSQNVPAAPAGIEPVSYPTEDGLELSAWFIPPDTGQPTVVLFPGNAGNRADRAPLGAGLAAHGFGVLAVDYRGYGGNPGSPSESGLAMDARAARAYLETRADVDGPIVYFGESLGAGVAIGLAGTHPPAALVLRSPFTSLPDAAGAHYPFLPVSLLLWDRYPNLERIGALTAPVLVVAGSADSVVPIEQSIRLHDAAGEPKHVVVIDGADHNDAVLTSGRQLIDEVAVFLDRVLADG